MVYGISDFSDFGNENVGLECTNNTYWFTHHRVSAAIAELNFFNAQKWIKSCSVLFRKTVKRTFYRHQCRAKLPQSELAVIFRVFCMFSRNT